MKTEFSTFDIVKGLDIQRGCLREWMNYEFISPSVKADGQGTRAVFNLFDVQCVALFRNLLEFGFNRKEAAIFLKAFRDKIKDKNEIIDYIIFHSAIKNGVESIDEVTFLTPGEWKFDIKKGNIDWPLSNPKFKLTGKEKRIPADFKDTASKDINWKNILIVNYMEIRENVVKAMGKV